MHFLYCDSCFCVSFSIAGEAQGPMISRRDFIKYGTTSTAIVALPFGMVLSTTHALAAPAVTYNLLLNSGDSFLLNGGGLLLFEQVFPGPFDSDGDGLTDEQEVLLGTDATNPDSDGDMLSDGFEVGYDGDPSSYNAATDLNPLASDTDNDGFDDDVEITYASDPININSIPATGDINEDGSVDVGDVLLANQISAGHVVPTPLQMIRGDVAPLTNGIPTPDGIFNVADLVVITRKALGLTSF